MSANKEQKDDDGQDLTDEIDRTMAEAEAAVSALGGEAGKAGGGPEVPQPEDAELLDDDVLEEPGPEEQIAQLRAEVEATKDKWLRAVADLDNYKKRVKREIDDAVMATVQKILPSFLPVMDNLERALEVAEPAMEGADDDNRDNVQQLIQGLRMVRDEFMAALSKHGITPVPSVGHPFDPALHDALQQFDSPDHAPGTVIREFEKGYKMKDRLLRPARVIVAGAGSTGAPPDVEDTSEA